MQSKHHTTSITSIALAVTLVATTGCVALDDADAPVIDTAALASQANKQVLVTHPDEFTALGMTADDAESLDYLDIIDDRVIDFIPDYNFVFVFEPWPDEPAHSIGADGMYLGSFEIVSKDNTSIEHASTGGQPIDVDLEGEPSHPAETLHSCTHAVEVDADELVLQQAAAPEGGICGSIAVIHSLVKLGELDPSDAFDGDHLAPGPLAETREGIDHKGMTPDEIAKAHKGTECKTATASTGDGAGMTDLISDLDDMMNDPNELWDCTLIAVQRDASGRQRFGHGEHIKKIELNAQGDATIQTTNGFSQGNKVDTVPKDPGSNTWNASGGANSQCEFTDGATDAIDARHNGRGMTLMGYVCCT